VKEARFKSGAFEHRPSAQAGAATHRAKGKELIRTTPDPGLRGLAE